MRSKPTPKKGLHNGKSKEKSIKKTNEKRLLIFYWPGLPLQMCSGHLPGDDHERRSKKTIRDILRDPTIRR